MPESIPALTVAVLALLPGALYVWAFERQVGRWGIGLSDRLLRFVGGSAVFHSFFAPATLWLMADRWPAARASGHFDLALWCASVAYVGLPILAGTVVGRATRREASWARYLTGPDPAPRAWDYLFQGSHDGWVRVRLRSGTWIGGAYVNANGRRSYAAGYPEPQDLFLAAAVALDPVSGEFLFDEGRVVVGEGGLLVRWEEVEYLEIDA